MLLDMPWVESLLTNQALWRGEFVDLWSIAHILAGMGLAYVFYVLLLSHATDTAAFSFWLWRGLTLAFLLGNAWEMFERLTGLSKTEAFTNSLTDIVLAPIGFALGFYLFRKFPQSWQRVCILAGFGIVYLTILYLGFAGFRYYGG